MPAWLWHASQASRLIGGALVPTCRTAPDRADLWRVCLHEQREHAEPWNNSPLFGRTVYRVRFDDVADPRRHERWPGVWYTEHAIDEALLEVVERRDGPTPSRVLEHVLDRIVALGLAA